MKRKYSIGFLFGIIIIIATFVFLYEFSYNKALDNNERKQENVSETAGFLIKEKDGYVIVYHLDGSVYDFTSIEASDLPLEVRQNMISGIKMENITEVYGFLENYSS